MKKKIKTVENVEDETLTHDAWIHNKKATQMSEMIHKRRGTQMRERVEKGGG
jgi:hypothetical protein